MIAFVDDFAELGRQLYIPVDAYSSGMRARLLFAMTLAIDFECFLIDEVFAVGDQRFHRKCHDALFTRRSHCAMILVSHDPGIVRQYCQSALSSRAGEAGCSKISSWRSASMRRCRAAKRRRQAANLCGVALSTPSGRGADPKQTWRQP